MRIIKKVKDLIKMNDFFFSTEMLRFNDESQYKTLTGGLISLAIIVIIMIGFATMIADTLSLNSITASLDIINQEVPTLANFSTNSDSNFMFAVTIPSLAVSSSYHYFDIKLYRAERGYNLQSNYTLINLEPCTKQHWKSYPTAFEKLSYKSWLCAPLNTTFSIQGKLTSQDYDYYYVGVYPCYKGTNLTKQCATATQVTDFFNNKSNRAQISLYITNPVINPSKKNYKSLYLQDRNFLAFGPNIGQASRLYFTDYTIKSDESIWPFENIKQQSGMLLEQSIRSYNFEVTSSSAYATFTFLKSENSIVYNRQVQKISAVFSFIGGMIGAVTAALFIIKMYTSAAYEISLALDIFEPSQESKLKKSNLVMNFWNYAKLTIFNLFKLCKREQDWPAIAYMNECQQEIINQLDVKSLIKRLIFMEHCFNVLFETHQLEGLKYKKPKTPQEIKEIREKCESVVSNDFDSEHEPSENSDGIHKEDSNYQLNDQIANKKPNHSKISPLSRQAGSPVQMVMVRQDDKTLDHAKPGPDEQVHRHHQRRKSFINLLKKDAAEGDRLSKRILHMIETEMKKDEQRQ